MGGFTPADVCNQALDAIGSEVVLGDLEDGTREASVLLRAYGQCVRQLLRAAHWNFARKTAPLTLLADATGQTPDAGNMVPSPWIYEYAYPIDCLKARFVPWNPQGIVSGAPAGNIQLPPVPLTTGAAQQPLVGQRLVPARFTEATDFNNPPPSDAGYETPGISPVGRTVILTNVQNAQLVYTALLMYPSVWDPQFRAALVAYIASEVALPLSKDKRFGLELRREQIAIAKQKITAARVTDGNEGYFSSDIQTDWMRARSSGAWSAGGGWGAGAGPGVLGYGWTECAFSDGSAY